MTVQKEEWVQVGLWRHLWKSNLQSSNAGERSDILYICCLSYEKSGNTKQDISPATEDSVNDVTAQLGSDIPFAHVILNPEVKFRLFER